MIESVNYNIKYCFTWWQYSGTLSGAQGITEWWSLASPRHSHVRPTLQRETGHHNMSMRHMFKVIIVKITINCSKKCQYVQ